MKIVTQEGALGAKDFCGLEPDPFGTVAQRMDLAVESPTRATSAVAPPTADFVHLTKGGGVPFLRAAQGLCHTQTYFLQTPRPLALARPRSHCTNHAAVRLGNHLLRSHGGQNSE